jgi:hypothetical protein
MHFLGFKRTEALPKKKLSPTQTKKFDPSELRGAEPSQASRTSTLTGSTLRGTSYVSSIYQRLQNTDGAEYAIGDAEELEEMLSANRHIRPTAIGSQNRSMKL